MKAKLVLSIVALVVVPTAILSLAAAFSIRSRESTLQKRLVATAQQSVNAVADSLALSLDRAHADAARSMSALLNTGQPDGMLPSAARLRADHELLGQIYVLDTRSGFLYPQARTNVIGVAERPPEWEDLSRLKNLYIEDKQYESAAREYQALLSEPGVSQVARAEAVLGAAQCYRQLGRFDFAAEVLRQLAGYTTGARAARRLMLDPGAALRDGKGRLYSLRALKALLDTYREGSSRDANSEQRWHQLSAGTEVELLDRLVFLFDYIEPQQREVITAALNALEGPERTTSALETIAQLRALLDEREFNDRFGDDLRQELSDTVSASISSVPNGTPSWITVGATFWSLSPLPGSTTRVVGIQLSLPRLQTYVAELTTRMGAEHGFTILAVESDAIPPDSMPAAHALASGRLRDPLDSTSLWAYPANPGALDRRRLWSHLQVWGIGILALGMLLGVGLVLRLASTELARARARTDFMAGISHDLHTPLASIRMLAESLHLGRVTTEEKRQQFLATILRESGRVAHLVERVLYFVRLGENALTYQLRPVDIGTVVRDAVDEPDVELAISDDIPSTMADSDAIAQLVRNLVDNAIKYSAGNDGPPTPVQVRVSHQDGTVLLSVQDHGIGIPDEDRDRIFRKFYRTKAARQLEASGIGLGLTLCRHIVTAHGGSISVDSDPGEGSTFCVTLPVRTGKTGTHE